MRDLAVAIATTFMTNIFDCCKVMLPETTEFKRIENTLVNQIISTDSKRSRNRRKWFRCSCAGGIKPNCLIRGRHRCYLRRKLRVAPFTRSQEVAALQNSLALA